MEFSRQEGCRGLPFLSPGDLPNPGMEPGSTALQADSLPSEPNPGPKDEAKWANEETQPTVAWLCFHLLPPTKKYIWTGVKVTFVIGGNLKLLWKAYLWQISIRWCYELSFVKITYTHFIADHDTLVQRVVNQWSILFLLYPSILWFPQKDTHHLKKGLGIAEWYSKLQVEISFKKHSLHTYHAPDVELQAFKKPHLIQSGRW